MGQRERRGRRRVAAAALAAALSAGACASEATAPPMTEAPPAPVACEPEPEPSGELELWHTIGSFYEAAVLDAVAAYEGAHPGVDVVVRQFSGHPAVEAALRDARDDELPDLVLGYEHHLVAYHDAGRFVPAQVCIDAAGSTLDDTLLPIVAETWSLDGELQAVPFNVTVPATIVNQPVLDAAGVEVPATPAEMRSAYERVVASGGRAGLVIDTNAPAWIAENWPAQRGTPISVGPGDIDLTDPQLAADLADLAALVDDGLVLDVGRDESLQQVIVPVLTDDQPAGTAWYTSSSAGIGKMLVDLDVNDPDRIAVAPFPSAGDGPGVVIGGGAWWFPATAHPGAAFDLASFLAAPEQQAAFAAVTSYVPVTAAAADVPLLADLWATYPTLRVAYDVVAAVPADGRFAGPRIGPRQAVREEIALAFQRICDGADPVVALAEADAAAQALIEAYEEGVGR